jgi:hypothetical protein
MVMVALEGLTKDADEADMAAVFDSHGVTGGPGEGTAGLNERAIVESEVAALVEAAGDEIDGSGGLDVGEASAGRERAAVGGVSDVDGGGAEGGSADRQGGVAAHGEGAAEDVDGAGGGVGVGGHGDGAAGEGGAGLDVEGATRAIIASDDKPAGGAGGRVAEGKGAGADVSEEILCVGDGEGRSDAVEGEGSAAGEGRDGEEAVGMDGRAAGGGDGCAVADLQISACEVVEL